MTAENDEIIALTRASRPHDMASHLIITAYSINSAFTTDRSCFTITGTSVVLPTPFSVVTATEPSATNPKSIQSIFYTDFPHWLNRAPTCSLIENCLDNECIPFSRPDAISGSFQGSKLVGLWSSTCNYIWC